MLQTLVVVLALAHSGPVLTGCAHTAQVRPHEVVIACADGDFYANKLTWSSWGTRGAAASGVAHVNDCNPYCAAGRFHVYRIALRLSHAVTCNTDRLMFARIAWVFAGARPAAQPRAGSETLPCTFLRLKP